jgi:Family of unknown function (DUF6868)
MTSLDNITRFLGWCTVINIVLYMFSAAVIVLPSAQIYVTVFGLAEADVLHINYQFLAQYKIAIFIFNLVPYIALKIINK